MGTAFRNKWNVSSLQPLFDFGALRPPLEPQLGHSECPRTKRALVTKSDVTKAALAPFSLVLIPLLRSHSCQHCPQDRLAPVRVPDKDDNSLIRAPSFIVAAPVTDPELLALLR